MCTYIRSVFDGTLLECCALISDVYLMHRELLAQLGEVPLRAIAYLVAGVGGAAQRRARHSGPRPRTPGPGPGESMYTDRSRGGTGAKHTPTVNANWENH